MINRHHALISHKKNFFINQKDYQKRIESLMYVMMIIRFDIAYVVNKLNQYCQNLIQWHCTTLNRIFCYLFETINLILLYDNLIIFICYADAAYKNNVIDQKLAYRHVMLVKNKTVI